MASCLLAVAVAATALLVLPGQLSVAARTSPAEAFWRTAMPGAAMPDTILELIHPETDVPNGADETDVRDRGPEPPMNFNYDDYRGASPDNERATAAPSPDVLNRAAVRSGAAASASPIVFFLEDALRVGESLPLRNLDARALRLYTVRSVRAMEGSSFVVCRGGEAGGPGGAVYGCRATGPARAYVVTAAGERGGAVTAAALCRTDTARWDPEHAAFRLLGVKPGGAVVCRAVDPGAQLLSAKERGGVIGLRAPIDRLRGLLCLRRGITLCSMDACVSCSCIVRLLGCICPLE